MQKCLAVGVQAAAQEATWHSLISTAQAPVSDMPSPYLLQLSGQM